MKNTAKGEGKFEGSCHSPDDSARPAHNKHTQVITPSLARVAYGLGYLYILYLLAVRVMVYSYGVIIDDGVAKSAVEISVVSLFSFLASLLVFFSVMIIGYWMWGELHE